MPLHIFSTNSALPIGESEERGRPHCRPPFPLSKVVYWQQHLAVYINKFIIPLERSPYRIVGQVILQGQCLDNFPFWHVGVFFGYPIAFKAHLTVSPVRFKVGGAGDVKRRSPRVGDELLSGLLP